MPKSQRLGVMTALFFAYIVHCACLVYVRFFAKDQRLFKSITQITKKMYLFGAAGFSLSPALLSAGWIYSGIFPAIFSWITLISFTVLNIIFLTDVQPMKKAVVYTVFIALTFVWYLGILMDYYINF